MRLSPMLLQVVSLVSSEGVWVSPRAKQEQAAAAHARFACREGDHVALLAVARAYEQVWWSGVRWGGVGCWVESCLCPQRLNLNFPNYMHVDVHATHSNPLKLTQTLQIPHQVGSQVVCFNAVCVHIGPPLCDHVLWPQVLWCRTLPCCAV